MYKGKHTCETLKAIRKQIADANDIPYEPRQCTHQGDCLGTCPVCEFEVRYIEDQLNIRKMAGKAVKIIGLASMVSLAACTSSHRVDNHPSYEEGDIYIDDSELGVPPPPPFTETPSVSQVIYSEGEDSDDEGTYAEFPGGDGAMFDFLEKNIKYSKSTRDLAIVEFFVERDGSTSNIKIRASVDSTVDKEIIRVIKMMPKWTPATYNGGDARAKITLNISLNPKINSNCNSVNSKKETLVLSNVEQGDISIKKDTTLMPPIIDIEDVEGDIYIPYEPLSETKAKFIGGDKAMTNYLTKKLVYPRAAQEEGIEGTVIVKFVVNKDGSIIDIEVVQSVHPILDKEAVRIIRTMHHWIPAKMGDRPIRTKQILPIKFKLNN